MARIECTEVYLNSDGTPTPGIRYRVLDRVSGLAATVYDAQTAGTGLVPPLVTQSGGRLEFWAEEATYYTIVSEDDEFPDLPWLAPPTTGGGGAGEVTQAELDTHTGLVVGVHGSPGTVPVGDGLARTAGGWEAKTFAKSGTVDTVTAEILVQPASPAENGIVIKAPDEEWGDESNSEEVPYGSGQALIMFKEPTDGLTAPLDLAVLRIDRSGGIGSAGAFHLPTGFNQRPGYFVNYTMHIDPRINDTTGIIVDSYNETPTRPWQQWRLNGGTVVCEVALTGAFKANRSIELRSKDTSTVPSLILGRGPSGQDGYVAIATSSNELATGSAAGDLVIQAYQTSGKILLRGGLSSTVPSIIVGPAKLGFFGATAIVKPTVTGTSLGSTAVQNLCAKLQNLGLINDDTT